jgi:hypothetical protein
MPAKDAAGDGEPGAEIFDFEERHHGRKFEIRCDERSEGTLSKPTSETIFK